jgi:broad specificity phosphatase PhoE
MAAKTPGDLAVVTHGLVCHSLVARHLRLDSTVPQPSVPLRFDNTSVTEVESSPPWVVRRLNCTVHLNRDFEADADGAPV